MGGVRPNASENGQIGPSTTIRAARAGGSRPNLASILQEGRKNASIYQGLGVIWRIPVYMTNKEAVLLMKAVALLRQSMSRDGKPRKTDMSKLIMRAFVVALFAGLVPFSSPARAEIQYPWCVQYGGGRNGIGATSCGFVSREQCMATARGLGAMCVENPAYPTVVRRPVKIRHPRRRHSQ
jgi:hypothetical protein